MYDCRNFAPTPDPKQIGADLKELIESYQFAVVGQQVRLSFYKDCPLPACDRWMRVWQKTEDGWKYIAVRKGYQW
jgi:hypothetical protein